MRIRLQPRSVDSQAAQERCAIHRPGGRRPSVALALLALIALTLFGACGRKAEEAAPYRPDIMFILVDALRMDRLGVNGYPRPTTPRIDELAAEGVSLTSAFSHSTWTKPSITTLFTCLYPIQHGLDRVAVQAVEGLSTDALDQRFVTLAERFQAAAYTTGAVINQVHLQQKFGFAKGFDHFVAVRGNSAFELNRRLERWLVDLPPDPFFGYLHYLDAHWPYRNRLQRDRPDLGPTRMEMEPPSSADRLGEWAQRVERPEDWEGLESRYDHEVAFVDRAVGQVVDRLKELGRYDDTIIVVTSDHGEGFMEHGELVHGFTPYEEVIRIPLVLRLPQPLRGRTGSLDHPVGIIDLMPTLLELAGLEPEPQCQGQGHSFAPLIRGAEIEPRTVFAQGAGAVAVRSPSHKLLVSAEGEERFFDLEADPQEQSPLEGPCSGPCGELRSELQAFLDLMERTRYAGEAGQVQLEESEVQDLRALGYLE